MDDALNDFERFDFDDGRWSRPVYRQGTGPAVIVIHEMPGLHPRVLAFARDVAVAGMSVYCPSLFGVPGKPTGTAYMAVSALKTLCVRREFTAWAADRSSPIVDWLRALARKAHAECGGAGVGAVGMCFTGGFALAMMTEPSVVAPVLAQPSLPLGAKGKAALGCSAAEIACAKGRFAAEDLSMIGLRFHGDKLSPGTRFRTLEATFGDRFEAIELDTKDARQGTGLAPHSTLTTHLDRADPDGPTMRAHARVIDFFRNRTGAAALDTTGREA
jgi:dienelactone hydrolase